MDVCLYSQVKCTGHELFASDFKSQEDFTPTTAVSGSHTSSSVLGSHPRLSNRTPHDASIDVQSAGCQIHKPPITPLLSNF